MNNRMMGSVNGKGVGAGRGRGLCRGRGEGAAGFGFLGKDGPDAPANRMRADEVAIGDVEGRSVPDPSEAELKSPLMTGADRRTGRCGRMRRRDNSCARS